MRRLVGLLCALAFLVAPAAEATSVRLLTVPAAAPPASVTFIAASQIYLGSTSTLPIPTGSAAGDLEIVEGFRDNATNSTVSSAGGAWTTILAAVSWDGAGGFNGSFAYYRVLNASDISNGNITINSPYGFGMAIAYTFRGATACTFRSSNYYPGSSGGSVTITGYTPGVGSLGAILLHMSRDTVLGAGGGSFVSQADSGATWPFGIAAGYDNLTYAGGNFSFTPNVNATADAYEILCELS